VVSSREIAIGSYRVVLARGALERAAEIIRTAAPAHRYAIITDSNVGPIYAPALRASLNESRTLVFTIPAGEVYKTRDTWAMLTDGMLEAGFGRDTTIVALGGGVVGDLAGFVAATYMRGVPYVQIPTTLLAMIDASVGGKTGVDTPVGKNLVGAFHQPAVVIADIMTLSSLPIEHLRAGAAEAIKHGVIADAGYFNAVREIVPQLGSSSIDEAAMLDLVARSIEIKADVVNRDERESGVRKTLNFGHTIGHAVESASGFSLLHGEAVAIGMVYESALAERIGVAEAGTASRVREAVRAAGLPETRPASVSVDAVLHSARGDKKARAGRVEYALPTTVGHMAAADRGWAIPVSDAAVREVLS
jgi:3-dehydroquinate synthase